MAWIRFLGLFLMYKVISKLFFILLGIMQETLYYLLILAIYIMVVSSIFITLYTDIPDSPFSSIGVTVRLLFDAMQASYSYNIDDNYEVSYSILMILHIIISHILLLNYMIAVYRTAYYNLRLFGVFEFKCNLFIYCNRYLVGLEDEQYGHLILSPPPLNFFSLIILPLVFSKKFSKKANVFLSYLYFWVENIFLFIFYLGLEFS